MRWRWEGAGEALRSPIPWVSLSAALALTVTGWIALEHNRHDDARVQFERRTETAEAAVRTRMLSYEQILRSGAARIASSPSISRREWHDFIAELQLEERFPGIRSIGYAERVKPDELAVHVKRVRADGIADYDVRPPGDRVEYFPIVFNEPFVGRNARVVGLDMFAEPVRRSSMERARDSADATISGKVEFSDDPSRGSPAQQPGFVMYVPVFRREARTLAPAARDAALAGFVASPLRMSDLMRGILDDGVLQVLDMQVYDGDEPRAESALIDTRTAWRVTSPEATPTFTRRVSFPMPGRTWTIQFVSRPEFDANLAASRPWALLAAGLLASAVLFTLTVALVAAWNRAHELSMRDPLTGLYNRRYLQETMGRELPRARRLGQSVGVIVIDIDHFKHLNDTYGHDAGDLVLEKTGELLRATNRKSDIACRFGGEEFAVVLPGATLAVARNRAEGIRASLEALRIDFDGKPIGPLTVSAGVACLPPHSQDWGFVMQQADRALYTAKQAGRNRVVAAVDD
ncbi:MAG: diguanylate cyclase [Burkholderiales bacterium]|nr:diguanylate cyclase [Burkholderiales bacterium]